MVGTEADALEARARAERIMRGTARFCYLLNGVVYKRCIWPGESPNLNEFDAYNNLVVGKDIPEGIGFPAVSLYRDESDRTILAMEYIEGDETMDCYCDGLFCDCESPLSWEILTAFQSLGFHDLCPDNIVHRDGVYYLIDMEI